MNDTTNKPRLPPEDEKRLLDALPWYINGTLPESERQWVDALARTSDHAAMLLARERIVNEAVSGMLEPVPEDVGLARLLARVHPAPPSPAKAAAPGLLGQLGSWLGSWTGPRMAGVMATVVAIQFGVIGWLASAPPTETSETRGVTVTELRTLRVHFVDGATEKQLRSALLAASARIVAGPNQVGEYWLASSSVSVDEMRKILLDSGLTSSIEVDTQGPN
jgi:hypothetical protein